MNVKEAGAKWGLSGKTVSAYCAAGLIPDAEKSERKWIVPEEQEKPPAARGTMVRVLRYIKNCAAHPGLSFAHPLQEENFRNCVDYLQNYGFISRIGEAIEETDWSAVALSDIGEDLIRREEQEEKKKGLLEGIEVSSTATFTPDGRPAFAVSVKKSKGKE